MFNLQLLYKNRASGQKQKRRKKRKAPLNIFNAADFSTASSDDDKIFMQLERSVFTLF